MLRHFWRFQAKYYCWNTIELLHTYFRRHKWKNEQIAEMSIFVHPFSTFLNQYCAFTVSILTKGAPERTQKTSPIVSEHYWCIQLFPMTKGFFKIWKVLYPYLFESILYTFSDLYGVGGVQQAVVARSGLVGQCTTVACY